MPEAIAERPRPVWRERSIAAMALLLTLPMGLVLAVASVQAAVLLAALGLLTLALVLPWTWLLGLLMVLVFVVVGPLQYVAGLNKAFWLPYLLGLLMWVRVAAEGAVRPARAVTAIPIGAPNRWVTISKWALALLLATAALSSAMAGITPLQILVGAKEYCFLGALPLAMAIGVLPLDPLRRLPGWIVGWLLLQLPFVAWQRFWVAPNRGGDSPWDAVVGLFTGSAFTGGGSGAMAMVSLSASALVTLAWRSGLCKGWMAAAAVVAALLACAGAEVKMALPLIPLLGTWIGLQPQTGKGASEAHRVSHILPRAGLIILMAVAFSGVLAWIYQTQYTSSRTLESQSLSAYADSVMDRNLDDNTLADAYGEMTRLGAIRFWWQQQDLRDVPAWLVGHGVGASRRGSLAMGDVARRYPFEIGRSTLVMLLWETGVLGTAALIMALLSLVSATWQLQSVATLAAWRWLLHGAGATLITGLISLPYGGDWMQAPQLGTALLLMVGVVWAADHHLRLPAPGETR